MTHPASSVLAASSPISRSGEKTNSWYFLAMLCALIIISAIDRLIVSLVIIPMKADIGLSDTAVGLIFGSTFAIVYGIAGLPLARLVDQYNRKMLIFAGLMLWSAATFSTAFVHSPESLIALRMALAIGEAVLTPAAVSLIGDLFSGSRRELATSIYMTATQFGAHLSYIIGGLILMLVGAALAVELPLIGELATWRAVFVCVGIPGLVLGPIFLLTTREPVRRATAQRPVNSWSAATYLWHNSRLYAGLFIGIGINASILHAYGTWFITFLVRHYAWKASDGGYLYGLVTLVASVSGAAILPMISARIARRGRGDAILVTAAFSMVFGNVIAIGGLLSGDPHISLYAFAPAMFAIIGAHTLALIALHELSPAGMLGTLTAVLVLSGSALGMTLGPPLTGFLTERVFSGPDAMLWALVTVPALVMPISCSLLLLARKPYLARKGQPVSEEATH